MSEEQEHLNKRITFVLPGPSKRPVGGYKIVYEYANYLSSLNYKVTIVHPAIVQKDLNFRMLLKRYIVYLFRLFTNTALPKWITIDKRVSLVWSLSASQRHIPDGEYIFATAWQTAEWVKDYSSKKGRKLYLIQGLETWGSQKETVLSTLHYPFYKIVISRWLQNLLVEIGEESTYIPNGLDFKTFGCDLPIESRFARSIAFLYHEDAHKGSSDCIKAIKIIRDLYPDIVVKAFGASVRPEDLPEWIEYSYKPTARALREIYNSVAIFVSASYTEGWGLTASEALQCGTALAASDIGGHREFAIENETALLFRPGEVNEIVEKIKILMMNNELRYRLANQGRVFVKRFTWDASVKKLTEEIENLMQKEGPL